MTKKILAVLLALTMLCAFAACGAKEETATETETEATETEIATEEETEATEAASEEETEATEAASEESETEAEEASEEDASEAESEEETEAAAVPSTTAEILALYNDAVNGAVTAGYHKNRNCAINSLEGGAILKISVAKEAVYNFLGVGTKEWDNTKGKSDYMKKASLTASDVTSAKCELKDGKYIVTINIKDGASSASAAGSSDTSPLGKTGLYTGEGDKSEYDYKNAGNIYYALNHTDGASLESGELKATKGVAKATIDAESGKLESLEISFNFNVVLTTVKYSIATIKQGTGDATTVVKFTNFKY